MNLRNIKQIKDTAIKLHREGKSINEINKTVGMKLNNEIISSWTIEENEKNYRTIIFRLYRQQKDESNRDKRRKILEELREKLEDILKIIPDDIDMKTKLMYTYINLNQMDKAKDLGYKLLKVSNTPQVLNGVSIIEEKSKNYTEAIKLVDQILKILPDNEFYKNKRKRLYDKSKSFQSNNDLHRNYAKIATLERSVNSLVKKKEDDLRIHGEKIDHKEIYHDICLDVYIQIKSIAEQILEKYPDEIIAKEKLVKALYCIDDFENAKSTALNFLQTLPDDEIILYYLCKIARSNDNLLEEKEYLEKIINSNPEKALIKNIMRLDKVNYLLEKQAQKEQKKQEALNITYTEEDRRDWVDRIANDFKYGKITSDDIDYKIKEARKYPNYVKSLIELLDLRSLITEDFQAELDELNTYLETEPSISKEDYKDVLDAMTDIKKRIDYKKIIDSYEPDER